MKTPSLWPKLLDATKTCRFSMKCFKKALSRTYEHEDVSPDRPSLGLLAALLLLLA